MTSKSGPGRGQRAHRGSTTRPSAPRRTPRQTPAPQAQRRGSPQMRRLGVLGGLILFLGLFLGPTVHSYLEQRSDINELERTIVSQQQEIGTLEQDLADWDDPAFVEQQARERLRFVKPGEIAFTVQDDTGEQATEPVPGMAAVTRDAAEHQPWYGQVWESVRTANDGLPETDGDGRS